MKINEKISDENPSATVRELDVVTFKFSDSSRGAVKGHTGTVMDMTLLDKFGYQVENDSGNCHFFQREEFRLATPKDIARLRAMRAKTKARAEHKDLPVEYPALWGNMFNEIDEQKK